MKIGDYVVVTAGELKGFEGSITAISSDPEGVLCQLERKYWIEKWNIKPVGEVKVKYFNENCYLEKHGDWIDVKAAKDMKYKAGDFLMIPLGIAIKLPANCEAHLLPRSSTFKRYGIIMTNSMGVIDEEYCGDNDQWFFPALAMRDGEIKEGNRIGQFRTVEKQSMASWEVVDKLDDIDRGGFGSSGE